MDKKLPANVSGKDIETFDPSRYRLTNAALDFGIEEAKRIMDWPTLEKAIDAKIKEQQKFVGWWKGNVPTAGQPRKILSGNADNILSASKATKLTGMTPQRVSDLVKKLKNPEHYRQYLLGVQYLAAFLADKHVRGTLGTGENEWFTPPEYIELARKVLGEIDLDPASHKIAQQMVKAKKYYTIEDNGLTKPWKGRVWLNPPYAQPHIEHFVDKMIEELQAKRVTSAVMLTHNYTDTAWFQKLAQCADAICFTRGRIKFIDPEGGTCAPTQGQAFFYFGDDRAGFIAAFIDVGFVMIRP